VTAIRATEASLDQLPQILPPLLQNLSIGRSHIALEQLQIATGDRDLPIVLITVVDESTPIAAAIAIQPPGNRARSKHNAPEGSSAATMVHAGPLSEIDESRCKSVAETLATKLNQVFGDRQVQFVQWATDTNNNGVEKWCEALGFEPIAELEYLSGTIERAATPTDGPLSLHRLDWEAIPEALDRFTELVERTYINTADCPRLTHFRTARQTLDGYQDSTAFAPELWYRVVAPLADGDTDVGCVILSNHSAEKRADAEQNRGDVIELVYMGLAPESRGRRYGPQVMAMAVDQARLVGGDQMIMAVDRNNTAARRIYHHAGFQPILAESVWAKSI
jgi:ribosomal protein S18 acetylase RimI-like enzyme